MTSIFTLTSWRSRTCSRVPSQRLRKHCLGPDNRHQLICCLFVVQYENISNLGSQHHWGVIVGTPSTLCALETSLAKKKLNQPTFKVEIHGHWIWKLWYKRNLSLTSKVNLAKVQGQMFFCGVTCCPFQSRQKRHCCHCCCRHLCHIIHQSAFLPQFSCFLSARLSFSPFYLTFTLFLLNFSSHFLFSLSLVFLLVTFLYPSPLIKPFVL